MDRDKKKNKKKFYRGEEKVKKYWSWWLGRNVYDSGKTVKRIDGLKHVFFDVWGLRLEFTAEQVAKLKEVK